jgi:Pyruvate/2-oxoacid:ferredoxin oxidoreductase gamma subunit
MERELMMTGIGGQGVQLAARVLALAAVAEGRTAQLFGSYGGTMRGGNTDATLIVADGPITSPPTISVTWSALIAHPEFAGPVLSRLAPGGLALNNSSVAEIDLDPDRYRVVNVAASDIAIDAGHPAGLSMVLAGAYASITGLVSPAAVAGAIAAAIPAYRSKHIDLSVAAVMAGAAAVEAGSFPAWTTITAVGVGA